MRVGVPTTSISNRHKLIVKGAGGVEKTIEGFETYDAGAGILYNEGIKLNNLAGKELLKHKSDETANLYSINCGYPDDNGDSIMVVDKDGGSESDAIDVMCLELQAAVIKGATTRDKYSRYYIFKITASQRKSLGSGSRLKGKLEKCDVFIGPHLVFGPSENNALKDEFLLNPDNPIPYAPAELIKEIIRIVAPPSAMTTISDKGIPEDSRPYLHRHRSLMGRKMKATYMEYMRLAEEYRSINPSNHLIVLTSKAKENFGDDLYNLSKEVHRYILRNSTGVNDEGYYHPNNIPVNGGAYNVINRLSLDLACDPSFDMETADKFLRFYNTHFDAPINEGTINSIIKHMYEDTFRKEDFKFGKEGEVRWFYDPNWEDNCKLFGRIFYGPNGNMYSVILNKDDNNFYLVDYARRVHINLGDDKRKAMMKAANNGRIKQIELIASTKPECEPQELCCEFVADCRSDFGIDYSSYNPDTDAYLFNTEQITNILRVQRYGYN